jgi:tRNA (guanine37-N1)-methyltransferase
MGEQQWCLRVARTGAEETRKKLLLAGILDLNLKIRAEEDYILFPVLAEQPGTTRAEFEPLKKRAELPRHEQVGGIVILQEDDPGGAALILEERPSVHTALYAQGGVSGEFRTRRFRVLAGESTTETTITEYGHTFRIDLEKAYFSARLASERQRVLSMIREREEVIDMFAGVGPFAIILSEKASVVWACDLNPGAVSLLMENITLNRVRNVIPVLCDAGTLPGILGKKFDRVIMNLPLHAGQFLEAAGELCRSGGTIHFYALVTDAEGDPSFTGFPAASVRKRFVRSYAPGRSHMVYDITVA